MASNDPKENNISHNVYDFSAGSGGGGGGGLNSYVNTYSSNPQAKQAGNMNKYIPGGNNNIGNGGGIMNNIGASGRLSDNILKYA